MDEIKSLASAEVYSDGKNATMFYLWEPAQQSPQGWTLAGTLTAVAENTAKHWGIKARATDEKWQATMEQAIPHFKTGVQALIDQLNQAGLGLKDLPTVVALANTPELMNKLDQASNRQMLSRIQTLQRESRIMARAYYHDSTDSFLLLPEAIYGTPAFDEAQADADQKGARPVAVVALMKDTGPDGGLLFEYEVMPGATEEIAQRARDLFRKNVIEAGLETGEITMETGHS